MAVSKSPSASFWSRFRAPLAGLAVVGFLGAAVVAPFAMPSAQAEEPPVAMKERIYQEFVPNTNPEADLVYTDIPVEKLPDPKPKKKVEKTETTSESETTTTQSTGETASAETAVLKYEGGGSPAEWMKAAGIAEADWGYVDYIASRESGWNPNATNAGSGACGLIQALPCSKVPGNGYDPVDNLKWASGYAIGRYGSWKSAYEFWTSNHWW